MPNFWRQRFTRLRNPSNNRQTKVDPPGNASTSDVTTDATIGSQDLPSSKDEAPVVQIVSPSVPTSALPIDSTLLPRNSLPPSPETEVLLGDQIDLWDEAYKKLKGKQPKLFEHYTRYIIASDDESATPPLLSLDNLDKERREQYLADQIEKKLQTIQEQEWSTASDMYKKIVKTVLFAKDFVRQAVSNEPHAALAWAGVSVLLPLLLKPDAQRQAATEGLAVVSDLILEYRVIEKTFRSRSRQLQTRADPDEMNLITDSQSKIVGLYSQILEFQIRMVYYYSRHGLNRYMRDLVTSDDWQGMQTTIDASRKAITEMLNIIGNVHLDNALEAQKSQFQHFSEQSMPILKSLHSVVTRIENFVNDAGKAQGSHLFSLGIFLDQAPRIEPDAFIGRINELQQLQHWLSPKDQLNHQRIVSIVGMGGMGKTQLSLAQVRDCARTYSSIFWVNAKDEISLRQSMARISAVISKESATPAAQSAGDENLKIDKVRRWLSEPGNDQWLFIFDNYDDPRLSRMDSPTGYDIRGYFPQGAQGSILITTRSPRLPFAKQLRLKKLEDIEQSLAILAAGSGRNINGDTSATRLAQRLDGLPLALATAGAYLSQSMDSFNDYFQQYNNSWNDLSQNSRGPVDYEERTLYSTWNVSFKQIREQDHAAAELLKLMAYLDNQDLWYELFHKGICDTPTWWVDVLKSPARFTRAISTLHNYSLLEVGDGRCSLHTCVHDWALECLNREFDWQRCLIAIHCVAASVSWSSEVGYWERNRRVLPHARRFTHIQLKAAIDWSRIEPGDLYCFTELYQQNKMMSEAEEMCVRALRGYEKALGPNHTSTLNTVNNLGNIYADQDKIVDAEHMHIRALQGKEKVLGPDHTLTLDTVNNLGNLYIKQGKIVEAEQMYIRALRGKEKVLGPDHTSTLDTVSNLGGLYANQGKILEAEQMYLRALQGYEKAWGPDYISTLGMLENLGNIYADQGKIVEAEQMYTRALRGYEKEWGPDHTATLSAVDNLGNLYADQGKIVEAEQMYKRALRGKEKVLGPSHTSTLDTVNNLGTLYADQGKIVEAEQMYVRALRGKEKVLGPDHMSTLGTVNNLGVLYADQGKMVEAEQMYTRALRGYEKVWGPDHTATLDTVNNLGLLYANQGKIVEAEQMYTRALQGYEKARGPDFTTTLDIVNNLGTLHAKQGKIVEADGMYVRALRGYEKAWGPDHTLTLNTVNNLGVLYENQGKIVEAEQMYVRALRGYEKAMGKDHPRTQKAACNLQRLHAHK